MNTTNATILDQDSTSLQYTVSNLADLLRRTSANNDEDE